VFGGKWVMVKSKSWNNKWYLLWALFVKNAKTYGKILNLGFLVREQ
jgi:hypothetical protein